MTTLLTAEDLAFDLVSGLGVEAIDERLRRTCRVTDLGNRATAFYLADLHVRGLHQVLGMPTTVAYAVRSLVEKALVASQDELDRLMRRARPGDAPPDGAGMPHAWEKLRAEFGDDAEPIAPQTAEAVTSDAVTPPALACAPRPLAELTTAPSMWRWRNAPPRPGRRRPSQLDDPSNSGSLMSCAPHSNGERPAWLARIPETSAGDSRPRTSPANEGGSGACFSRGTAVYHDRCED